MTDPWKSSNEIDASNSESAKEFIIGRYINIETVFIADRSIWRFATFFKLIPVKGICAKIINKKKIILVPSQLLLFYSIY